MEMIIDMQKLANELRALLRSYAHNVNCVVREREILMDGEPMGVAGSHKVELTIVVDRAVMA